MPEQGPAPSRTARGVAPSIPSRITTLSLCFLALSLSLFFSLSLSLSPSRHKGWSSPPSRKPTRLCRLLEGSASTRSLSFDKEGKQSKFTTLYLSLSLQGVRKQQRPGSCGRAQPPRYIGEVSCHPPQENFPPAAAVAEGKLSISVSLFLPLLSAEFLRPLCRPAPSRVTAFEPDRAVARYCCSVSLSLSRTLLPLPASLRLCLQVSGSTLQS